MSHKRQRPLPYVCSLGLESPGAAAEMAKSRTHTRLRDIGQQQPNCHDTGSGLGGLLRVPNCEATEPMPSFLSRPRGSVGTAALLCR